MAKVNRKIVLIIFLVAIFAAGAILIYLFLLRPKSLSETKVSSERLKLLPYGASINTKILEEEKIKSLELFGAPTPPPNTGKNNPFIP